MKTLVLAGLVLIGLACVAQTAKKSAAGAPDAAWMQQVWDAWNTLDPANAAKYYDKSPQNTYFDIAPMEYKGWAAYESGAKKVLAGFQALNCKVADPALHNQGSWGWGTSLVDCDAVMKDGSKSPMHFRYTGVWQKKGSEWLIVHEQISAPLPEANSGGMW